MREIITGGEEQSNLVFITSTTFTTDQLVGGWSVSFNAS